MKIAIKRTMGLGDVVITEPIARALKNKYSKFSPEIHLYSASDIGSYLNAYDKFIKIPSDFVFSDYLSSNKVTDKYDLKIDLDLAYETRIGINYLEAYAFSLNLTDVFKNSNMIPKLDYNKPRMIKEKYITIVGEGSGWTGKEWDLDKLEKIVLFLKDKGYKIVEPGIRYFTGIGDYYNKEKSIDALINYTKYSDLYIGADNGPMHLSIAANVPSFIIAGAALPYYSCPNYFYQEGNNSKIKFVHNEELDCIGCKHTKDSFDDMYINYINNVASFVPRCINKHGSVCMRMLSYYTVKKELDAFLNELKFWEI